MVSSTYGPFKNLMNAESIVKGSSCVASCPPAFCGFTLEAERHFMAILTWRRTSSRP